jgi:ABC-type phosphate/phosphonate transport system substrate-binding protein
MRSTLFCTAISLAVSAFLSSSALGQVKCHPEVLLVGGTSPNSAELYDPATQAFASTSQSPSVAGTATLIPNGKVLITGDSEPQLYNPISKRFISTGAATDSGHPLAIRLQNGNVFLPAGSNSPAEVYNWRQNTFGNVQGTSTLSGQIASGAVACTPKTPPK